MSVSPTATPGIRHAYNIIRLHVLFAAACGLLLVLIVALVWVDFDREWKRHQREFRELELAQYREGMVEAIKGIDGESLQVLEKKLEELEGERDRQLATYSAEVNRLQEISRQLYGDEMSLQEVKGDYDSIKYAYEVALHGKSPRAESLARKFTHLDEELHRWEAAMATHLREKAEIETLLKKGEEPVRTVLQEIAALKAESSRIEIAMESLDHSFVNDYFRNLPLLDFISPTIKIEQVVLPQLLLDINFKKIPRVDRCTTCHKGIARPGFENFPTPYRSHSRLDLFVAEDSAHPLEEVGCTPCHKGRGLSTSFIGAAHTPSGPDQEHAWRETYGWEPLEHWEEPMIPLPWVQSSCRQCHMEAVEVPEADRLNQGTALIEQYGCFGCHEISGVEHLPEVGPSLLHVANKLDHDWVYQWLSNPRRMNRASRMPQFFSLGEDSSPLERRRSATEIACIVDYLFDAAQPVDYEDLDVEGDLEHGKYLVENVGCTGCHEIGPSLEALGTVRKFGPNLANLRSKISIPWLFHWLKAPGQYSPSTRMPNLRLSDQEAIDIAAYLVGMGPDASIKAGPSPSSEIVDAIAMEFLTTAVSPLEAQERLDAMTPDTKRVFVGEKLIVRYGCFGCHEILGFEDRPRIGTSLSEIGSKAVGRLDFGFAPIPHTREAWLARKMAAPRSFDAGRIKKPHERLKMPEFGFSDDEVAALTTALLSFRKETITLDKQRILTPEEARLEKGRRLIRHYNCQGCHVLEGKGGDYAQTIMDKAYSPPPLDGEGVKVQPEWLFAFLKKPETIRPWLRARMPAFLLSDEEINGILGYFAALAKQVFPFHSVPEIVLSEEELNAGAELIAMAKCMQCHQFTEDTEMSAADLAPDLSLSPQRLMPDWIVRWLEDPQVLQEGTRMPSYFPLEDEDEPDALRYSPFPQLGGNVERQILAIRNSLFRPNDHDEVPTLP